jgi:hypothetical protein
MRSSDGQPSLGGWVQVRTLLNESNPRMHPYVLAPLVNNTTGALLKFLGDEAAKRRGLPPSLKTSGLKSADAKQHGGREASAVAGSQSDSQRVLRETATQRWFDKSTRIDGREQGPVASAEAESRPRERMRRATDVSGKCKGDEL